MNGLDDEYQEFIDWINADFQQRVLKGEKQHLLNQKELFRRTTLSVARQKLEEKFGAANVRFDPSGSTKGSPGYDFVVSDSIRVKVAGCRWKEILDFNIGAPDNKALENADVWLVVDFCGLIDGCVGKYAETPAFAATGEVAFWLAPTDELRALVSDGEFGEKRVRLQWVREGSQLRKRSHDPLVAYRENWAVFSHAMSSIENRDPISTQPQDADDMMNLISNLRKNLGLTQKELADRVGLENSNFISMIEAGKSRLPHSMVPAMALALEVEPKWLAQKWMRQYQPEVADALDL